MALIKCNECGREISSKAVHCIGCGVPLENLQRNDQVINKSNDDDLNAIQNNHEKNKTEDISNLPREERIKKIIAEKKQSKIKALLNIHRNHLTSLILGQIQPHRQKETII